MAHREKKLRRESLLFPDDKHLLKMALAFSGRD
jgi:hypothetical protein